MSTDSIFDYNEALDERASENLSPHQYIETYNKAESVRILAPWKWMYETDIFVIEDSKWSIKYYVSVMGMETRDYSIAIFKEARHAYEIFNCSLDVYHRTDPSLFLEIPHLKILFRDEYVPTIFYKCIPGQGPAPMEKKDLRIISLVLDCCLEFLPTLEFEGAEELSQKINLNQFLHLSKTSTCWKQKFKKVTKPQKRPLVYDLPAKKIESIKKKPENGIVQIDFRMLYTTVTRNNETGEYFPYLLLIFSSESIDTPLGYETFIAEHGIEKMHLELRRKVIDQLYLLPNKPKTVNCYTERIFNILKPVMDKAEITFFLIDRPNFIELIFKNAEEIFNYHQ